MRRAYTPSLPELQAFVQAASMASATHAGDVLGLTQSAISRSLASLEARLGVRLFHRAKQRLTLSDAGRAFLPQAQAILAQFWHGHGDGGGMYLSWFLPLALLTVFRPNLEDRVAMTVLGEGWFSRRAKLAQSKRTAADNKGSIAAFNPTQ